MSQQTFTTLQVADITGLSVRQLNHWAHLRLFVPGAYHAHGSGTRHLYTHQDLVQLASLKRLKCYRWSTQKIQRAIAILRDVMKDENPLRRSMIVADSKVMVVCKTKAGEQIMIDALVEGGQQLMNIVLEIWEEETQ